MSLTERERLSVIGSGSLVPVVYPDSTSDKAPNLFSDKGPSTLREYNGWEGNVSIRRRE